MFCFSFTVRLIEVIDNKEAGYAPLEGYLFPNKESYSFFFSEKICVTEYNAERYAIILITICAFSKDESSPKNVIR